jgi:hypothetical protein
MLGDGLAVVGASQRDSPGVRYGDSKNSNRSFHPSGQIRNIYNSHGQNDKRHLGGVFL